MNCPVCNSTVLYEGLTSLECAGRGCQNYKGPAGVTYGPEVPDFWWACAWATQVARGLGCLDKIRAEEGSNLSLTVATVHGLPLSPLYINTIYTKDYIKEWCLENYPDWAPYL